MTDKEKAGAGEQLVRLFEECSKKPARHQLRPANSLNPSLHLQLMGIPSGRSSRTSSAATLPQTTHVIPLIIFNDVQVGIGAKQLFAAYGVEMKNGKTTYEGILKHMLGGTYALAAKTSNKRRQEALAPNINDLYLSSEQAVFFARRRVYQFTKQRTSRLGDDDAKKDQEDHEMADISIAREDEERKMRLLRARVEHKMPVALLEAAVRGETVSLHWRQMPDFLREYAYVIYVFNLHRLQRLMNASQS